MTIRLPHFMTIDLSYLMIECLKSFMMINMINMIGVINLINVIDVVDVVDVLNVNMIDRCIILMHYYKKLTLIYFDVCYIQKIVIESRTKKVESSRFEFDSNRSVYIKNVELMSKKVRLDSI